MYEYDENNSLHMTEPNGERRMIANFKADIKKETKYDDGLKKKTVLTISGKLGKTKLQEIEVPAQDFASMAWVLEQWGCDPIIMPGYGAKEHTKTAIQLHSKPKKQVIYTHTGWNKINGKYVYMHAKGGVGEKGNDDSVKVMLPPELSKYAIEATEDPKESILATLSMLKLGRPEKIWPLIAAVVSPIVGKCDFAIHYAGRTGTYKSEIASLAQSHYGAEMDSRCLPGSWSSTANALEAQAYRAKNAVFCVDDFIPSGTSWQVRAYQKTADQLLRGQGNQAGRARLTDASSLQTTMYPRGIILSTGEDTPEGHSIRARMLIVELSPDDINTQELSRLQKLRPLFQQTIGNYAKWLAANYEEITSEVKAEAQELRDVYIDIGHSRTPSTIGQVLASIAAFLKYATSVKAITEKKRKELQTSAVKSILEIAERQDGYLQASDPCEAFCEAIRHMLASHIGHLRTKDGGIPGSPETLGWTKEESKGDIPAYKSHGKCIGWIEWTKDELYIDAVGAYSDIKRHSGGAITVSKQTMFKRLRDAGLLTQTDDARQRNTIRITCDTTRRQVLAMPLSQVLEVGEKPKSTEV